MDATALILSRLQFAFTISFHIIFPSFTIGLAAWLATLEGLRLATGREIYRVVFEFWLKIFGVAFGMGVVSGDAETKGIGAMTDARWKTFFDTMSSEGLYDKKLPYRNAYDLRFVTPHH